MNHKKELLRGLRLEPINPLSPISLQALNPKPKRPLYFGAYGYAPDPRTRLRLRQRAGAFLRLSLLSWGSLRFRAVKVPCRLSGSFRKPCQLVLVVACIVSAL